MAVDLVSVLRDELSGDTLGKIASIFGESAGTTQSALGAAIPAILAAATQKAASSQGAADLLDMVKQATAAGGGGSIASLLSGSQSAADAADLARFGAPVLTSLFGDRTPAITEWIAAASGTRGTAAGSLLRFIAPVVLAFVGRQASASGGLSVSSLTSVLAGQSGFLKAAAPPGLASVLGFTGFGNGGAHTAARIDDAGRTVAASSGAPLKWLVPLVMAALAVLLFALRPDRTPDEHTSMVSPPSVPSVSGSAPSTVTSAYGVDLGALLTRVLPGGIELNIPEKGVEGQLLDFIEDAAQPVSTDKWFTLDRLEFETGSATLRPSAQEQLGNIAAILNAFPNVSLKVGGYTDNVGDDAANLTLSQSRAANAVRELVRLGVEPARLEAEGYGEQHPVDTNDTEEGRQRNRRIDVRVTKK